MSGSGNVHLIGTAIIKALETGKRENRDVVVRAIGAGAVNQAVKALAFSRGILARSYGVELACAPFFSNVPMSESSDGNRTAMSFQLFDMARSRR